MKKRGIAAALILVVLVAVTIWSGMLMRNLERDLTQQLDLVTQSAQNENWVQAKTAAEAAKTTLRKKQTLLAYFIAHTQISELDTTLCALPAYAQDASEDLLVETERARSQLRALSRLFFRTL